METTVALARRVGAAWRDTRGMLARRLLLDRQAELWLRAVDSTGSLSEIRARVVDVVRETRDTRTFVLRPNRRWRAHEAGQWVTVEVEIDGTRARRCYSVSSAPGDGLVSITVKRVPGGRVSSHLHERVRTGDVLVLGPPSGDFVVPSPAPAKLLMIAGGSGITPLVSMLRALAARGAMGDVVLVHHARTEGDVVLREPLEAMAERHRGMRYVICLDDAPSGGFDEARLAALVPDLATRETFLCGPPGLMARVEAMWRDAGLAHRLHTERFTAPLATPRAGGEAVRLHLVRSKRAIHARTTGTLLDQLELAGERPASGCRMGICHSCTCVKRSGTVRHALTGAVSSAPDESIQLCVSVPCTDVELSL